MHFEPSDFDVESVYLLKRDHMATMRKVGMTMKTEPEFTAYLASIMRPGTSRTCIEAMSIFFWAGAPQHGLPPIGPFPGSGRPDASNEVAWAHDFKNGKISTFDDLKRASNLVNDIQSE